MKKIKVAVVEDSEKLRRALDALIRDTPDMQFLRACADAEDALQSLPSEAPDIVLMDIRLPGMSGIECVARLTQLLPSVRVLMLTAYEDSDDIFKSLEAGAYGYLVKSTEPDRLVDAIREVASGGSPTSSSVARKMIDYFRPRRTERTDVDSLAPKEREVLRLLAEGCPYKEIAGAMSVLTTNLPSIGTNAWAVSYIANTSVVLSVTNRPPIIGYDLWAGAITNGMTNYNQSATQDGYPNLLKYAIGSSQTNSDNLARMSATRAAGGIALNFNRNTNATDVTLIVEGSYSATNGAMWTGITTNRAGAWNPTNGVTETSGSPASVSVKDNASFATNRFMRVRVSQP